MIYRTEKRNLFDLNDREWSFAHCISLDCKMGAGIAVDIKKQFHLSNLDEVVNKLGLDVPSVVYHNKVFNLITKKRYYHKPTYETMEGALKSMKKQVEDFNIPRIAMPKMGSGLDGLSWPVVEVILKEVFKDTDVEIFVCYI